MKLEKRKEIIRYFNAVKDFMPVGSDIKLVQLPIIIVSRDVRFSIPSNKCFRFSQQAITKHRKDFNCSSSFSVRTLCLILFFNIRILIMNLISQGNFSIPKHIKSRVCNFCNLHIEFGSFLIWKLPLWSRYLKCFKLPILLGNALIQDLHQSNTAYQCLPVLYFQWRIEANHEPSKIGSTPRQKIRHPLEKLKNKQNIVSNMDAIDHNSISKQEKCCFPFALISTSHSLSQVSNHVPKFWKEVSSQVSSKPKELPFIF
ncbi:hypothetical protein QQP08_016189 [Theobroma cacao]|nr:hypothetical protein QQP08_016189 [Theobroma cacao]